jgi:2-phosphoglycerate kinase
MVQGEVGGKIYTEPFSKGVLSRSLTMAEMGPNKAYAFASCIHQKLKDQNIQLITIDNLVKMIVKDLEDEDPVMAEKYIAWRNIRACQDPLIILIGGSSGVGTSSIAFEIANRLGIKNMISTDMIREVMRKIVSKELSPVIHESSFTAYKGLRSTPIQNVDPILAGFIHHVDTVCVGIEAVIERALKEGISIIIEGVHIVPGFIKKELIEKNNVVLFTLMVSDEEIHKGRFYSRSRQLWSRRPLQLYLDNFDSIRKTQNYFINQGSLFNSKIIDNIDVTTTSDIMSDYIVEKYGGMSDVK